MNRHDIESQLIEKASADLLGAALPPGMTITVLEEAPGHHYLVLPPAAPAPDALPLDDLELALVGGGRTLRPFTIKCGASNTRSSASNARSSSRSSC